MNTVILSDGTSYYIPNSDLSFFKELALRMKWQDQRTTAQIVEDIHNARTNNSEIIL